MPPSYDIAAIILQTHYAKDGEMPPDGALKFSALQLYVDKIPKLVIAIDMQQENQYVNMLERFLKNRGIAFDTATLPDPKNPMHAPLLTGDAHSYHVVGAGRANLNLKEKTYSGLEHRDNEYLLTIDLLHREHTERGFKKIGFQVQR